MGDYFALVDFCSFLRFQKVHEVQDNIQLDSVVIILSSTGTPTIKTIYLIFCSEVQPF